MQQSRAAGARKKTRIQMENEKRILDAALETFSAYGFRGTTLDQIAEKAGMSKPNVLYYFSNKEDMHRSLLNTLLDTWLAPLRDMDADGDPLGEIQHYIQRKIEMARDQPRESRLFANEILHGAPGIEDVLKGSLKQLVDEKAAVIQRWIDQGKLRRCDPHHLIFSIWATTQHYADFDAQVCAVLGQDRTDRRFDEASEFLSRFFEHGLKPAD